MDSNYGDNMEITDVRTTGYVAEDIETEEEVEVRTVPKPRPKRQRISSIWSKFTITNTALSLASCNVCGVKLSFKSTTNNLKKHLARKHAYSINLGVIRPIQPKKKIDLERKRPNLTELGGLDGLILNVVGEDGEDPLAEVSHGETVGDEPVVYAGEVVHDYCVVNTEHEEGGDHSEYAGSRTPRNTSEVHGGQQSRNASRSQQRFRPMDQGEKSKKSRIMDLQLECLEIKKYTMQMEALLLEHQLSLPRSIFTQQLHGSDTMTRGTQTDVGGNNTKVFYVTENGGTREEQHLFTFQARLAE